MVVIVRDTAVFKNPATDYQMRAFNQALAAARVTAVETHFLQVDPLRPIEVPPGDFSELIRKTPAGSVIVSFMGPPVLTEAQRVRLGNSRPAVVAFCPGSLPDRIDLPMVFTQGLLQAAVISRRTAVATAAKPASSQGWFDRSFEVVTAANAAAILNPTGR